VTDPIDTQIASTMRRHAESTAGSHPDLAVIEARARAIRRSRTVTRTGLVVATVAIAGSGVALAASYVGGEDPDGHAPVATDPASSTATDSPSPTEPSTSTGADADPQSVLLDQLASSTDVRQYLFLRTDLPGLVLCGLNTMGEAPGAEPGTRDLYVWLECSAYRTGPAAESLTGGADPAVVTVRDDPDGPRIERVEFPPMHYTVDQLGDLFPPEVVDKLRSRPLPVSPTDDERLATAAAAPAG